MGLQKYNYFLFVQIYSQGNVGKRQAGEGTRGQGDKWDRGQKVDE